MLGQLTCSTLSDELVQHLLQLLLVGGVADQVEDFQTFSEIHRWPLICSSGGSLSVLLIQGLENLIPEDCCESLADSGLKLVADLLTIPKDEVQLRQELNHCGLELVSQNWL